MTSIVKMAFRNIGRSRRRTILTAVTAGVVVMVIIFMQGYMTGMMNKMFELSARFTTGHLKVLAKGYADKEALMPLDLAVIDSGRVAKEAEKLDHVTAVSRRIKFFTMIQRGSSDEFPILMGIEPEPERKILMLDRNLLTGRYFGDAPREALLGSGLAKKLGVISELGDKYEPGSAKVQILAPRGVPMTFTVVGIFRFGFSLMDDKMIMIKFEDAQYAADMDNDDMATEVLVILDEQKRSFGLIAPLEKAASRIDDQAEVLPWQAQGFLYEMLTTMYVAIGVIASILFFISASTIVNTMLMAVMERTREIGMLMSLGMKAREIVMLVLVEAIAIGMAGGAVGAVLGAVITLVLSYTGIPIGGLTENFPIPMGDTLQVAFIWWAIPLAFVFGMVMSALASLWPAVKAARMSPTEALRTI